jgi:ubiquinone/menaquinone biosynthesis C-methylase UbiE
LTKSLAQQRFGVAAADYATSEVHAKGASLARLVELTEPKPHWRVLDVATGAGHTALAFAPNVAKVTATDITTEMLAEAKKLAAARGLANVRTLPAKAEDLPFPDASFDLVVCRLAAHHFDSVADFVSEAFRVLLQEGALALVDNVAPDDALAAGRTSDELREWAGLFNDFKKALRPKPCPLPWPRRMEDAGERRRLHGHARRVPGQGDRIRGLGAAHALRRGYVHAAQGDAARRAFARFPAFGRRQLRA